MIIVYGKKEIVYDKKENERLKVIKNLINDRKSYRKLCNAVSENDKE